MIPYQTFPTIQLGPVAVRTFGLAAAAGMLVGLSLLRRQARNSGLDDERLSALAVRLVLVGLVGARLAYVITHLARFAGEPSRVIAVWDGGLQFFGGFIAALAVLWAWLRRHPDLPGLAVADCFAPALAAGLAIGRVGCYAVGEHLGRPSSFLLATRYEGGPTVEGPLALGVAVHNTALYEAVGLLMLLALLRLRNRQVRVEGSLLVVFLLWYGIQRFITDAVRAYDDRFLGLTAAQFASAGLIASGLGVAVRLRRQGVEQPPSAGVPA